MNRVSILTTNAAAARFDDFVHGDTVLAFDLLTDEGPRRLVEGPAWVFVDWVMKGMDGWETCRRIRDLADVLEYDFSAYVDADPLSQKGKEEGIDAEEPLVRSLEGPLDLIL